MARDGEIPVHFGPATHVVWKVALPRGHSSPVVHGERIFLTAFDDEKLKTLCLDRGDGQVLWQHEVPPGTIEPGSRHSSAAASTPAVDASRAYVYFGSFGLIAYTHEGREAWRRPLPTPVTQHGASTSPILAGDLLVLACDQDVGSYLLAVDRRSGETAWRVARRGFRRGFSTPLAWPVDAPRQVIVAGTLRLVAYDLADGAERWSVRGLPNEVVGSPVAGDGLVFAGGWTYGSGVERMPAFDGLLKDGDEDGDDKLTREEAPPGPARQHFLYVDADKNGLLTREEWESISKVFDESKNALLAVRPGGQGDVTESHVVWTYERGVPYVPSPLFYEGRIFVVKRGGIASCFDAKSGKIHFLQKRLGTFGDYYASPVAAGGRICAISHRGTAVILKAGTELEILARNELSEPVHATPAIVGKMLYVRTAGHLYAFRERRDGPREKEEAGDSD